MHWHLIVCLITVLRPSKLEQRISAKGEVIAIDTLFHFEFRNRAINQFIILIDLQSFFTHILGKNKKRKYKEREWNTIYKLNHCNHLYSNGVFSRFDAWSLFFCFCFVIVVALHLICYFVQMSQIYDPKIGWHYFCLKNKKK